jgi:hypothetical protein
MWLLSPFVYFPNRIKLNKTTQNFLQALLPCDRVEPLPPPYFSGHLAQVLELANMGDNSKN